MTTAVQLRQDSRFYCKVLVGNPIKVQRNAKGDVAIFPQGEIVAYFIAWERKRHLYVFRCAGEMGQQEVIGVLPAVDVLIDAGTRTRVTRLRDIITYLEREKISLSGLSEGWYARVQALIENKVFTLSTVKELFSHGKI